MSTLLLSKNDVAELLDMEEVITVVDQAGNTYQRRGGRCSG